VLLFYTERREALYCERDSKKRKHNNKRKRTGISRKIVCLEINGLRKEVKESNNQPSFSDEGTLERMRRIERRKHQR